MGRTRIDDVARLAGVSSATVDRVVNGRAGVRAETVEKVEAAIRRLGYQPDRLSALLTRHSDTRLRFVLPSSDNSFMRLLQAEIGALATRLAAERVTIEIDLVDVFDAPALAAALERQPADLDGLAVIALDDPLVRAAIDGLVERGVAVVTLVSDVPSSRRLRFIGLDNVAAGRSAGSLIGRFLRRTPGKIGLIAGSLALRDHAERRFGFEQVIGLEYPDLAILPVREGRDDPGRVEHLVRGLIAETPDLVGLYNVGGGNRGLIAAVAGQGRGADLCVIVHELTAATRRGLLDGTIDAVISQDPGHEARSATRVLIAAIDAAPIVADQERIRIGIVIRDNAP